jgi:hypothetical protein
MSFNSPFTGNVIQPTDVSFRNITLAADTQLSWPINGNATDNYAARIMNVTASSASLSLWMPPANQASVGQDALIRNIGANTFTVKDYAGTNTIVSIAAGECKYIYITTNSTTAGTWGIIAFGVGTSSPDAATLAGYGLLASSGTLNQSHPTSGISNTQSFASSDRAQTKIWTSGAGSITLPSASSIGNNWFALFKNNGSGTCTIACSGADLIDGLASKEYNPNEASFIVCSGSGYITIGYGVSSNFVFTTAVIPVTNTNVTISSSQAQSVLQEYQGALTANIIATYPPVTNLYVISNQTTNAFTLTIKTAAGNSVAIPQNQQATVVCDGINFYNANTIQAAGTTLNLVDGSVSFPSLTFTNETSTGVYRASAGQFNTTILGVLRSTVSATGLTIAGSGTFSGGVLGGTF